MKSMARLGNMLLSTSKQGIVFLINNKIRTWCVTKGIGHFCCLHNSGRLNPWPFGLKIVPRIISVLNGLIGTTRATSLFRGFFHVAWLAFRGPWQCLRPIVLLILVLLLLGSLAFVWNNHRSVDRTWTLDVCTSKFISCLASHSWADRAALYSRKPFVTHEKRAKSCETMGQGHMEHNDIRPKATCIHNCFHIATSNNKNRAGNEEEDLAQWCKLLWLHPRWQ